MYSLKEVIIVEGIYDKIRLSSFIDSLIFVTGGFTVFKNKKMQQSIRTLAEKSGIVIFTDSDSAGIKIRNFVKQLAAGGTVYHAYIPEIAGKERRKSTYSKEGLLGVEGISNDILLSALKVGGCHIIGDSTTAKTQKSITKTDFFSLGLSGGDDSQKKRQKLALKLGLPSKLSANMLLGAVNQLLTYEELEKLVNEETTLR